MGDGVLCIGWRLAVKITRRGPRGDRGLVGWPLLVSSADDGRWAMVGELDGHLWGFIPICCMELDDHMVRAENRSWAMWLA